MCCKCDSLNVSSFTYHSYEIDNVSYYEPLTTTESFQDSFMSQFSPLKTSSPKVTQNRNSVSEDIPRYTQRNNSDSSKTYSRISNNSNKKNESSPFLHIPPKRNLRILTVNCRSIRDKTSEFKATLNYTKPDIVIGTESWLKGIKPGQNPSKDAIKSSEIFPENYTSFRNDRGTLGGGVFILVQNNIIATEQPQYVTDCEIDWVKIKLKNQKDLLIGGFYMPHRNTKDMEELEKSLKIITDENNNNNIILAGDFNCPDITWETLSLKMDASDKEIQRTLIDITSQTGLTQIHEQPTRENNLLDLVFTTNPTLSKSSTNIPGISDHAIIVTDLDTKPYYQKSIPRKIYKWAKADWEQVYKDLEPLTSTIQKMADDRTNINTMWNTFKQHLFSCLDKHIPSKVIKSNNRLPWFNHKIRKMLRKKQGLYNQAKKSKKWANYRHYQKECKRQIRKAEWDYINTSILEGMEKNNSKPFWKYVKSRKQDNIGVAPLKEKGQLIKQQRKSTNIN